MAIPLFSIAGFATNLYISAFIIYRLWTVGKKFAVGSDAPNPYRRTIAIVVVSSIAPIANAATDYLKESGLIYPLTHVFVLILFAVQSPAVVR